MLSGGWWRRTSLLGRSHSMAWRRRRRWLIGCGPATVARWHRHSVAFGIHALHVGNVIALLSNIARRCLVRGLPYRRARVGATECIVLAELLKALFRARHDHNARPGRHACACGEYQNDW